MTNDNFLNGLIEAVCFSHINNYDESRYVTPLPKARYAFLTLMSYAREALNEGSIDQQRFSRWESHIESFASTL